MDRSHYTVLAQVSLSYSVPKGKFPRVTHPCATRPEGLVRLACVRHAASVRSEPESNSQVDVRSSSRGIPRTRPASLGAVPAQKSQTGVFAFLGHLERLEFVRSSDTQRLSVTGPPPTCPFIFNQQCQRADVLPAPVRIVPGIGYTDQEEARNERRPFVEGRVRRCEGHICATLRCVNVFLQFCCSAAFEASKSCFDLSAIVAGSPIKCLFDKRRA